MNQSLNFKQNNCLKSILYVSFVILFFQGISNTQLGIVGQFTSQNGQAWVGPLTTALLFLGSGTGTFYNGYISKMPYRFSFFIGSLGYTLFIGLAVIFLKIGFTTAVQVVILFGSFVSGVTVSMFYNSQFNYVNTCSQIDNQPTRYFGINMCIVQSANIVGNLISALLIEPVGQFNYAIIMNVSIFAISLLFLFVKDYKYLSVERKSDSQDIHQNQSNFQAIYQKESNAYHQEHSQQRKSAQKNPPRQPSQSPKPFPYRIMFSFCFSGIMIAFIFSELSMVFYNSFSDFYGKEELNRVTFVALIIEGIGEFFGGFSVVFGHQFMAKKLGISVTYVLATLIFLLSVLMVYFGAHFHNLTLVNVACLFIGYCNCLGFTLCLSIAGQWDQKGVTFFNFGQSISVAITSILIAFVKFDYIVIFASFVFILSSHGVLTFSKSKIQRKQDSLPLIQN